MELFRTDLTPKEEEDMRRWARENYEPLSPIKRVWHPIVQRECVRMNEEER